LWLSENAASQASVLQGLRENLLEENGARILLVELDNRQDQLTGFRPYLRTRNLLPVVDEALVPSEVEGWDDFQDQLRRLLATLGTDSIVQIHFLADPPLFDRPFHNLLAPSGSRLGEEFVVVLRHRERVHSRKPHVIAAWNRYADSLRPLASQNVRPVPLPSGPGALVGEDRGMGYFTRLLPATTGGEACSLEEKMLLMNLLRLGVPYLCWLHRASSAGWARQMELFLTACLAKGQTLEQFPDGFTQERLGGQALAMDAALLWDDPGQNPF
jgi:hypothetical protein